MNEKKIRKLFFALGETKYVYSAIRSADEDETPVTAETGYELIRLSDNTVEDTGELSVSSDKLRVLISPQRAGKYLLRETVTVGAETYIRSIPVTVFPG